MTFHTLLSRSCKQLSLVTFWSCCSHERNECSSRIISMLLRTSRAPRCSSSCMFRTTDNLWVFRGVAETINGSAVVLRCKYCSMSFLDFIKGLYFFPGWLCNFKELFIPVWREIHRSKILPVTSWQLTNRTVSDISRRSRHSIVNLFFFPWIYNMIQIHADETSRPPDFIARSVAARPRALKLASLTFQLVRGRLVASLSIFNLLYYVIWW